jgi:hypothetical protein
MPFDPTRPTSDRNRARPLTAADAFVQAEAKSRITNSRKASNIGIALTVVGIGGLTRLFEGRRFLINPDIHIAFPGGHSALLTVGQFASLFIVPAGMLLAVAGAYLNARFKRDAMANPVTAGIFDPSVEWSDKDN